MSQIISDFEIISLIIQALIAVGTISAVSVSLWQSQLALRQLCKVRVQIGSIRTIGDRDYFTPTDKLDDTIGEKIVFVEIFNYGLRDIDFGYISIEDIISKKGILLPIKPEEINISSLSSGKTLKFTSRVLLQDRTDINSFYSQIKSLYSEIKCAKFRLRFTVKSTLGKKFRCRLPKYLIEHFEKN